MQLIALEKCSGIVLVILVSNVTQSKVGLIFINHHNFYDNSDSQLDSLIAIPVDTNGICYVAGIVDDVSCIDRMEESNDDSESEDDNFDNNKMYTNKKKPMLLGFSTAIFLTVPQLLWVAFSFLVVPGISRSHMKKVESIWRVFMEENLCMEQLYC